MQSIAMTQPRRLVCGPGAAEQVITDLKERNIARALFLTGRSSRDRALTLVGALNSAGTQTQVWSEIAGEPTIEDFDRIHRVAVGFMPDALVGIGGGSVLDVAKLVAAMLSEDRPVRDVLGINLLRRRSVYLACLPTTAGTGSEVSPNSILLDEQAEMKKGIISRWLVPDAAYIDPLLMTSMPALVTAGTGIDALTHCIEAYANRAAHPLTDRIALDGIRLISRSLLTAISNPDNLEARSDMAYASLFGGLCLGPVNTAAVHALAYPLGGRFHIPHGIANALMLPHVLEFNLPAAPDRYAAIAVALGAEARGDCIDTAKAGISALRDLMVRTGIPMRLSNWHVPKEAVAEMADAAMQVTRLLKNNPRQMNIEDAIHIYESAFSA